MFEKWRIKEHMEVVDSAGTHVGTVDEVEDNRIKLTRSDSNDRAHHFLDWETVDRIEDNRVYLKQGTPLPTMSRETATAGAGGTGMGSTGGSPGSSSANYGGSEGARDLPGTESKLFGTSGHGTGMGGSGTS